MELISKIKQKGIPGFLLKTIVFLAILFLLDFSIGHLLRYLYFKQDSGLLYRTGYSIDSTRADILIFGSSTANHHYYPGTFEKRMHMSLYNAGRDGNSIFYHYSVLLGVLKRYSPEMAILDFNMNEFKKDELSYDCISSLFPYYCSHPEIRPIVKLKGPYEKYKLLSGIYPFNSLLFTIIAGNLSLNKSREVVHDEKGYIPLIKFWDKDIALDTSSVRKYPLDSTKLNIFKSFIKHCQDAHVKLYIVISPRFVKFHEKDTSILVAEKIAREFNVPVYNFLEDPQFLDNAGLFADQAHLNDAGAKIFSNKVIDNILKDRSYVRKEEQNLSEKKSLN